MKQVSIMIKPASSLCDLRCKYCFYADVAQSRAVASFGMMKPETVGAVLANVAAELQPGDKVHFVFQGGEPTLAGLDFYRTFVSIAGQWQDVQVTYALQTNGILLDEEWCKFLKEHDFLVGVSLDLLRDCHDEVRVDARGHGTWKQVTRAITLLDRHAVEYNVLCTLTNAVARHPRQVWQQLQKLDVRFVQFTPCLGELEGERSPYALTPKRFADFYVTLFDLWREEIRQGKWRSVKFFDDVVNLLVLGRPTGCGMDGVCRPQLVVEADGSVYPCDFYCTDEYRLGNLTRQTVSELLTAPGVRAFVDRPQPRPGFCEMCPYDTFCAGNCPRMRREICYTGQDAYCGYRDFLDRCGEGLAQLARKYSQRLRSAAQTEGGNEK